VEHKELLDRVEHQVLKVLRVHQELRVLKELPVHREHQEHKE
jgi:hypothetical protein